METVFTFRQYVAKMILEWVPCSARLTWIEGNWCFEMKYHSISIVVAKGWYRTCLEQLNRRRQSVVTSRRLGDVHTAEIFFDVCISVAIIISIESYVFNFFFPPCRALVYVSYAGITSP